MQHYEINEYRATKEWPYAISAGCVVYRTGKSGIEVLLLSRNPGHENDPLSDKVTYMLPKGHVAIGEPIEAAALRETEEEAGMKAELTTYLGAHIRDFMHPKRKIHNIKTTHYFAAAYQADLRVIDHEHDARLWLDIEDAIAKLKQTTPERGEFVMLEHLKQFLGAA